MICFCSRISIPDASPWKVPFPDTYQFTRIDTSHQIAAAMVHRFRQEAQKIGLLDGWTSIAWSPWPPLSKKKPRIRMSGRWWRRLLQRLNRNMTLAADPSVIYAALLAGRYRGTIYASDLQYESPYNTYKYPGLPPAIADPRIASLQAAMHPKSNRYLYFVSDNNGHHRFARDLEEHARNVAAYRKWVAASQ